MPQRRTRFMLYICCLVWFLLPMHSIYGGTRTLDNTQREISPNLCVFAVAASNFGCCALCLNYARCYLCAANFVRRRRGSLNGLSACAASMMFFYCVFLCAVSVGRLGRRTADGEPNVHSLGLCNRARNTIKDSRISLNIWLKSSELQPRLAFLVLPFRILSI